jgi:hypothetical protein
LIAPQVGSLHYPSMSITKSGERSVWQACENDTAIHTCHSRASRPLQNSSQRTIVRPLSVTHIPQELTHHQSKAPTQTQKLKTLQKLVTSFFHNVIHIMSQLSDPGLLKMAVTESTKILPYVISNRKTVKLYLKVTFACNSPFHSPVTHTCLRRAWTCGPQRTTAYELLRFVPYTGSRLHLTNLF